MLTELRKTLLSVVVLILAISCVPSTGDGVGPVGDGQTGVNEGDATSRTDEDLIEPPPATLTIDGRDQTAGIGTYCWNPGTGTAVCADMVGIPTVHEPLGAGQTFLAEFELPVDGRPQQVSVSTQTVSDADAMSDGPGDYRWWPYEPGGHYTLPAVQDPSIELTLEPGLHVLNLVVAWDSYGDASFGFLVEVKGDQNPDAAAFAEYQGISLDEANRRLGFQDSIGQVQQRLMTDLSDTFGGLWVEHQPAFRVFIALTDGGESVLEPYLEGVAWADFVEIQEVNYTLDQLRADQNATSRAAGAVNVSATTAVDIVNNRVEFIVGNPDLLQSDLAEAGIELPDSVVLLPIDPGGEPTESNQGVLLEAIAPDGRTIYLPTQAPAAASMAALMEGTLVEVDGCLRLTDDDYPNGFMVIWPYGSDIRVAEERIEVLNDEGATVARVGQLLRAGGGAIESSQGMANVAELIPGMTGIGCEGPYWVAGPFETLEQQLTPDIYFEPFSSDDQRIVLYATQSRPSPETEILSGELRLDEENCLRLDQYFLILPPGSYLREDPLRVFSRKGELVGAIGDSIEVTGAEKSADDYRFFENKVRCPGPFWGVNQLMSAG